MLLIDQLYWTNFCFVLQFCGWIWPNNRQVLYIVCLFAYRYFDCLRCFAEIWLYSIKLYLYVPTHCETEVFHLICVAWLVESYPQGQKWLLKNKNLLTKGGQLFASTCLPISPPAERKYTTEKLGTIDNTTVTQTMLVLLTTRLQQ